MIEVKMEKREVQKTKARGDSSARIPWKHREVAFLKYDALILTNWKKNEFRAYCNGKLDFCIILKTQNLLLI